MRKSEMVEYILAAPPAYTPESGAYERFASWLSKQSEQNVFMIYLAVRG